MGKPLIKRIIGRSLFADLKNTAGKTILKKGSLVTEDISDSLAGEDIPTASVRSLMHCRLHRGVCQKCYGMDLSNGEIIDVGEAVGVVAAQAIGEPGTQLTMRTFHTGGVATAGGDITMGLPRVEEVFECRIPKLPAAISRVSGVVTDLIKDGQETVIVILPDTASTAKTAKGVKKETEYRIHPLRTIHVKVGDQVQKGQFLTDGSADLEELFLLGGKEIAQQYIINEITRIYELQGVSTARKHLEIIVKQMFSRVQVSNSGDTGVSAGEIITDFELERINKVQKEVDGEPAKAKSLLLGITEVSLTRASFLSAISFQNTPRKLAEAAVSGAIDRLIGLKENVIIGRLIPAGTGFKGSKKHGYIQDMEAKFAAMQPTEVPEANVSETMRA
jgi:DNA-directed RNA polymerase subunit beta'